MKTAREGKMKNNHPYGPVPDTPTPDKVPEKLNLEHIPPDIMRSNAINSLLSQNEDLMARLSVALRRISSLEEQLNHSQHNSQKANSQIGVLRDQVAIIREKALAVSQRKGRNEAEFRKLNEGLKLEKIKNAELLTSNEELRGHLEQKVNDMKLALKKEQDRANELSNSLVETSSKYQEETKTLKEDFKNEITHLTQKIESENNKIEKKHKAEVEALNKKRITDQEEFKQRLNHQISDLQRQVGSLETEKQNLKNQCAELDRAFEENSELRNKLVFVQRQHDDMKLNLEGEVQSLQKHLAKYRGENRSLESELEDHKVKNNELSDTRAKLETEISQINEQVENLQSLWRETQSQLDESLERNRSLQKVSQQLSKNLNMSRNEVNQLKDIIDSENATSSKKIQELKRNIGTATKLKGDSQGTDNSEFHPQSMNKIDSLIAEIQAGSINKP